MTLTVATNVKKNGYGATVEWYWGHKADYPE